MPGRAPDGPVMTERTWPDNVARRQKEIVP
jgi:hypothetical protein